MFRKYFVGVESMGFWNSRWLIWILKYRCLLVDCGSFCFVVRGVNVFKSYLGCLGDIGLVWMIDEDKREIRKVL